MPNAETDAIKVKVNNQFVKVVDWMTILVIDAPTIIAGGDKYIVDGSVRVPNAQKWADPLDPTKIVGMPDGIYFFDMNLISMGVKLTDFKANLCAMDSLGNKLMDMTWFEQAGGIEIQREVLALRPVGNGGFSIGIVDHWELLNLGADAIQIDGIIIGCGRLFGGLVQ